MKIRNLTAMLLTMTLSLGASQAVLAGGNPHTDDPPPTFECDLSESVTFDHPHLCRGALYTVVMTIRGADLTAKDSAQLQSKVCAADSYLHSNKDKTDNAIQKLGDIIFKVENNPKIDDVPDETDIIRDAGDAQTCIVDEIQNP